MQQYSTQQMVKVPARGNGILDVFITNCPFLSKPGSPIRDLVRSNYVAIIVNPSVPAKPSLKKVGLKVFRYSFWRLYRCFSISSKVISSLFDRYNIFTSDRLWIEVNQNAALSKIDIFMTTINKKKLRNRLNPNFGQSRPATEKLTPGTLSVVISK